MANLCVYIPPSLPSASPSIIRDKVVNVADDFLATNSNNKLIITGDFKHFKANRLSSDLNFHDIVQRPTRGNHILDHILISKELSDTYTSFSAAHNPPIGKADHEILIATLQNPYPQVCMRTKVVYDFRLSNINNLLQKAFATVCTDVNNVEEVNVM